MCSDLDFKSYIPKLQREHIVGFSIEKYTDFQHSFHKNTTPFETNNWDFEELQSFKVDVNKIDRLYHLHYVSSFLYDDWEVIVRMQYNDEPLYVQIFGNCWDGVGHIFVSRDVDVFMKCVLRSTKYKDSQYDYKAIYELLKEDGVVRSSEYEDIRYDYNAIYELLKEDGIHFEEESCKNTPGLQNLCYNTISNNIVTRQEYKNELPKMLVRTTNNFIKTKEAINHYDNIMKKLNFA